MAEAVVVAVKVGAAQEVGTTERDSIGDGAAKRIDWSESAGAGRPIRGTNSPSTRVILA